MIRIFDPPFDITRCEWAYGRHNARLLKSHGPISCPSCHSGIASRPKSLRNLLSSWSPRHQYRELASNKRNVICPLLVKEEMNDVWFSLSFKTRLEDTRWLYFCQRDTTWLAKTLHSRREETAVELYFHSKCSEGAPRSYCTLSMTGFLLYSLRKPCFISSSQTVEWDHFHQLQHFSHINVPLEIHYVVLDVHHRLIFHPQLERGRSLSPLSFLGIPYFDIMLAGQTRLTTVIHYTVYNVIETILKSISHPSFLYQICIEQAKGRILIQTTFAQS